MSWLRRQQDIASLFAVWALLFQVLLGPFAVAGHAFAGTSLAGGIICTTRGLVAGPGTMLPKENRQHDDCFGCSHSCRTACGMTPIAASSAIGAWSSTPALTNAVMWQGDCVTSKMMEFESCSRAPPILG